MSKYNCKYGSLQELFSYNLTAVHISESCESFDIKLSIELVYNFLIDKNYDVVGIKENDSIIGYILKEEIDLSSKKSIRSYIRNFTSENLISANTPLKEILYLFKKRDWIFLLNGDNKIEIITRADLQKMPVRILFFGMISLFEMNLLEQIEDKHFNDWSEALSENRIECAKKLYNLKKLNNQEINLLDCLQLCDKAEIIRKQDKKILDDLNMSKKKFKSLIDHIQNIRNNIAHSHDITMGNSWDKLIDIFEKLDKINSTFNYY